MKPKRCVTSFCLFTLLFAIPFRCFAASATVHVIDPAGNAVVGAAVYVFGEQNIKTPTVLKTDKTGAFVFDLGATGTFEAFMIDAKGLAPLGGMLQAGDIKFQMSLPVQVSGKVVDDKGQSAAGVSIAAEYASLTDPTADPKSQRGAYFMIEPFKERYTVKTDAAGGYVIPGIPAASTVMIQSSDPRYIDDMVTTTKGGLIAPTITVKPGTSISGKVLLKDGKPAVGYGVQASNTVAGTFTIRDDETAADGVYKITGLAPGTYSVTVAGVAGAPLGGDWTAPTPVTVTATVDEPGLAPDMIMTKGEVVTGVVEDSETRAAIAGVNLGAQDPPIQGMMSQSVNAVSDKDGKFTMHLPPGSKQLYVFGVPDDYSNVSSETQRSFTVVAGQVLTLDPILLKRALSVAGTAVDDGGKPVPALALQPQRVNNDGSWMNVPPATTSENGMFTFKQLVAGSYYIDPGVAWTVVSPKTFTAPLTDPLKLVLKKTPTATLSGSAVDTTGAPVSGVNITFLIQHVVSVGYQMGTQSNATTSDDGKFSVSDVPIDSKMMQRSTVTKDGYVYRSGGDVTSANGQVSISTIVLAKLSGTVTGVVRDVAGKPQAGAWVYSPDAGDDVLPVKTGADGKFQLTGLAVGDVSIYAASGRSANKVIVQASASPVDAEMKLSTVTPPAAPSNIRKTTLLLNQLINDAAAAKNNNLGWLRDQCAEVLAETDSDAAVNFILSSAEINTDDLEYVIPPRSAVDPVGAAKWAMTPIQRMSGNDGRGQQAAELGLAVAPYDVDAASALFDIAEQNINLDKIDQGSINNAMDLTALAYALHHAEADADYQKVTTALQTLIKNEKPDQGYSIADWLPGNFVREMALGNVNLAIKMLQALPQAKQDQTIIGVVAELVRTNPDGALTVFHTLDSVKDQPMEAWIYGRSLSLVMPLLYKADPQGALALARAEQQPELTAESLTAVADLMPLAAAGPIYEEAESKSVVQQGSGFTPACIAQHAWVRDSSLGRKLFKEAFDKTTTAPPVNQSFGQQSQYADFAFYYSHVDPAYSRLLIEKQFAADQRNATQNYGQGAPVDVAAMAAIDIDRANEMVTQVKDANTRFNAGIKLAQYLIFTQQVRDTLPFDKWSNGSVWIPGSVDTY